MRTLGSFSELADNLGLSRKQGSCGSSKADKLLGSGTGDIILFLNKISLLCFLLSTKLNEQEPWIPNFSDIVV
jgi:plant 3beta-hydroxysteroid-4alpha-carboxylate 3-dehydrogenase